MMLTRQFDKTLDLPDWCNVKKRVQQQHYEDINDS